MPNKKIFHQVANLVSSCAILASPRKITCSVKLSIIATFFSYLLVFAHPRPILGSLSNDDGDDNENGKKAFLYISFPSWHDYNVNLPNFTFCGGRDNKTTTSFFFSYLRYSFLDFYSKKICQHLTNLTSWNERDKV